MNYDAGNTDRLYSDEENLFSEENAKYAPAVARLLGRDAGQLVNADTMMVVLDILDKELDIDGDLRLLGDMLTGSAQAAEVVLELLGSFRQGIVDSSTTLTKFNTTHGETDT